LLFQYKCREICFCNGCLKTFYIVALLLLNENSSLRLLIAKSNCLNENEADILCWNSFKQGDREAFDNLFRRHYSLLFQYGSKLCQEQEILEDCIQELFIELWQSPSAKPIQSVKAYLLKALKYKLYRQLKTSRTLRPVEQLEDEMNFVISHEDFIVQEEDRKRSFQQVTNAINRLPNRQKEIIYLKIYQSLEYEEISEVMNINYQVARNLFYQAIKSLRLLIN